jgi:hypothetical protein
MDLVPTRPLKRIDSQKSMFTVMFSGYRLLALDDSAKRLNMNSHYFCDVVLEEARRAVMAITKKAGIEEVMVHMDNCQVHNLAEASKG